MIRRPPRSTLSSSSAASDVYKRQASETLGHPWPTDVASGRAPCSHASRVKALVWHDDRMAKDVSRGPSLDSPCKPNLELTCSPSCLIQEHLRTQDYGKMPSL